ncbi:hypothetical protein HD597_002496 [Nonomuraea thailandensis]|uniref:Uncharacterized protein n=1 Tax=Nonomuraea thailandensis TaxID=1188745 RepID=A0A9X2GAN4_9ACTN|nr:hypothetical protein [Nonomuraea thailandensis]MCP2355476.1 hypothetical protein [Nonomuraea thailandensis]
MNGTYERPLAKRRVEVVTVWYGHALSHWRGPRMPRFSSPMVSAWNPVLAQGLSVDPHAPAPYRDELWCDRWIAEALLYARKPYGAFTLPADEAMRWFAKSGGTNLVYHAQLDGELVRVVAGTSEKYAQLFDLDALIADYREALPKELAEREAQALDEHRACSPALNYVLTENAEALFAQASLSVRGLTLGYPPRETAARIISEAAQ